MALESEPLTPERLSGADCVVILADHSAVDYEAVRQAARLIVDTRNAISGAHPAIFKLGAPRQSVEDLLIDRAPGEAEVA